MKEKKIAVGVMVCLIVMALVITIVVLATKSTKTNQNNTPTINNNTTDKNSTQTSTLNKNIEEYKWNDFVISIDNHIIKMGQPANQLEKFGFIPTNKNYTSLLAKNLSLNTPFEYTTSTGNSILFYPKVYNSANETKAVKDTGIYYFDLNLDFIKKANVRLPGGILLGENTTIENITNSMGQYTKKVANSYIWENEKYSSITVHFDTRNKLMNISYDYTQI